MILNWNGKLPVKYGQARQAPHEYSLLYMEMYILNQSPYFRGWWSDTVGQHFVHIVVEKRFKTVVHIIKTGFLLRFLYTILLFFWPNSKDVLHRLLSHNLYSTVSYRYKLL